MKLFDVYPLNPIEIITASGSTVWDANGDEYLDLYGGHAVISIGHTHPHYVKRLTDQLNKVAFYSNSVIISLQQELAEKLGKLSGKSDFQLFLCNSGAGFTFGLVTIKRILVFLRTHILTIPLRSSKCIT